MMKKALFLIFLLVYLKADIDLAFGQNLNPQPNFATQILSASPSLYLNYNDLTTSFLDQISRNAFANTASVTTPTTTTVGAIPSMYSANVGGQVCVNNIPLVAGNLTSFSVQFYAAPVAGQSVTIVILNQSGSSLTIVNSFAVAVAATTNAQTFSAPSNFTAVPVNAGQLIGFWTNSSGVLPGTGHTSGSFYALSAASSLPVGTQTYTSYSGVSFAMSSTVTTTTTKNYASGTVLPRQPGFDNTQVNNTSAAFPYNGWNAAPNSTLGSMDWSSAWTMLLHVDRLNWTRSSTLTFASKGDVGSSSNPYWSLYLTMNGNGSQLCFAGNAPGVGSGGICTAPGFDAMPNGFNYDIVVSNSGTGAPGTNSSGAGNAFSLYINGLQVGGPGNYIPAVNVSPYGKGFGAVTLAVTGGSAYANTTLFTSTGGGPNCVVAGTMTSVNGVPTSIGNTTSASPNYGCTTNPTLVLTSPTGTGAVLTATLIAPDSFSAAAEPLMAPGYVSGGAYYGIGGTASTQTPTYIDEYAFFPKGLTATQIQSIYYQTKFYQGLLKPVPSTPYTLVFDDDGCEDTDNIYALALTIAAQKAGYIRLAGVVDTAGDGISEGMYRQMLDQAGLASTPMSVPSVFTSNSTGCIAANISTFNSSTPQVSSAYAQAKTMYRKIFAANPTTPMFIMLGGSFRGVADWMQSAADSISPLTGAQMVAQNAANGGAIYAQGLAANETFTGDNSLQDWTAGQYVVENNGAMPIYWYGGEPQSTGPGVLATRTSKDPVYLMANSAGTDMRPGYDSLPTQSFISNLFAGGVNVAISGSGTGYAAETPFTSTGGGANCVVTGVMTAVSGVPSSILSAGGIASVNTYPGIGSGCFTASNPPAIVLTNPTGTGAGLTATTTASPCSTVAITGASAGSTSTATCSHHYFLPMSLDAAPGATPVMEWFLNSLIDPVPGGAPRGN